MSGKPQIEAARSFSDGKVTIKGELRSGGYDPSIQTKFSLDIFAHAARALAAKLIALADEADAKVAKKVAAEGRRRKWRDQEIAAGRIKVIGLRGPAP